MREREHRFSDMTVRFNFEIRAYVDVPASSLEWAGIESVEDLEKADSLELQELVQDADGFSEAVRDTFPEVEDFEVFVRSAR